ncbi:MAG TPA: pitrilysin family protein [Chitinophagales bacterium]|nr:pitrilysin family protein [Chitinophagales bacterium]
MRLLSLFVFLAFVIRTQAGTLPENFFMTKLTNGLDVLVIEDNSVPLATIEMCVRNGSFTEDPEYNGLSHLYEHMFFKANKDLPSQETFMDRVNELGIRFNGTTSNERVNYFFTLGSSKTEEGLRFMNSAIRYPLFLEEEIKKENPVVDAEFQRNESNPFFFLQDDMARHLWGDLYSRKNTIGDHEIILTATPEKMRVIQNKYYYPNNSILVVAGDVKHEAVFEKAKAIFGDWKASDFDPFQKYPIPEFKPLTETKYFITKNDNARVPVFMLGLHGPDTRHDLPATYAADVFSYILQQESSRLQQELVDAGLALQVNVSYQTCKYTGPINIILVPNPAKVKEAFEALEKNISRWDSDDYFTDEQLETAKTLLAIDDAYGKESTSSFVHTVTYWWASASIDYYTNYVANLQNVTRDDIKRYVRTYITNKPMAIGLLVPPNMAEGMGISDLKTFLNR